MSDKDILQDTSRYQEILNTVVGSKVYYMFQEEVYKALKDPNNIELGNKIALDETLQFLLWEYVGETLLNESNLNVSTISIWRDIEFRLDKEGFNIPAIEADTFEEFLEELKEMKLEKTKV